jgi:hypothetical protein
LKRNFRHIEKGSFTMSKLVSLGLLALSVGFLSNTAFAGNDGVAACDYLKDKDSSYYMPSLYGLCVAWHNADEDARGDLADKFEQRAGYLPPGPPAPPPTTPVLLDTCPCWDLDEMYLALSDDSGRAKLCGMASNSNNPDNPADYLYFDVGEDLSRIWKFEAGEIVTDILYCDFVGPENRMAFVIEGLNGDRGDLEDCVLQTLFVHELMEQAGIACDYYE